MVCESDSCVILPATLGHCWVRDMKKRKLVTCIQSWCFFVLCQSKSRTLIWTANRHQHVLKLTWRNALPWQVSRASHLQPAMRSIHFWAACEANHPQGFKFQLSNQANNTWTKNCAPRDLPCSAEWSWIYLKIRQAKHEWFIPRCHHFHMNSIPNIPKYVVCQLDMSPKLKPWSMELRLPKNNLV